MGVNLPEKTIWVVRHGFRIDFMRPEWAKTADNPYNPPLDPKGLIQAEETAERLLSEKIDHIFASPFLRTLQTANIISEKLGKKFNVEAGLSEWLKDSEFKSRPNLYELETLVNDFPAINLDYKSFVKTVYPENREELDSRTEKVLLEIIDKYENNILLISHGSPIKSIYKALINDVPENYQPMCSVSRFDYINGKWQLGIDGESSHLTSPDTTQRAFYIEKGTAW